MMAHTNNSCGSLIQKTKEFEEEFRLCDDNLLALRHRNIDDRIYIVDVFHPFDLINEKLNLSQYLN